MPAPGGYGISQIEILEDSQIANKTIREALLKGAGVLILTIERKNESIPNPSADMKFIVDDKLICFGKLASMRSQIYTLPKQ